MRSRASGLALHELEYLLVIAFPCPALLLRIALGNGVRVFAHLLFLDLRPELHEGERTIEAHIGCAVVLVVETFKIAEAIGHLRGAMLGIAHTVEFVSP